MTPKSPLKSIELTASRIENYCIPIATTAPILRLFIRTFIDQRGADRGYTTGSGPLGSKTGGRTTELSNLSRSNPEGHTTSKNFPDVKETDEISETVPAGSIHGSERGLVLENEIRVKHEYEVRVEEHDVLPIMKPKVSRGQSWN